MEVVVSEKGRNAIVKDGYKFRFHKCLVDGIERWACCEKNCKSFFKLQPDLGILAPPTTHNHEKPDENKLTRQALSGALKRKATEDISTRPSKLIHRALRDGDLDVLTSRDLSLIKRNIHNARSSVYPTLPKSMEESHDALGKIEIKTNVGEPFLLVNDKVHNLLGFSTQSNLEALCRVQKVYVDGTFKSCPKHFLQVFTFHGFHNNSYVPLAYFVLPNKSTDTYTRCFTSITSMCSNFGLQFSPRYIYMDFEKAIHTAAKSTWPIAEIRGCRFHLSQSWYRKIQNLGLTREYNNFQSEKGKFLKYFFGLPFLEPPDVERCFTDYIMVVQPPNDERIADFTDYVFDNYISPEEAVFPSDIWAEFSASLNRTTNCCESFHSKLNRQLHTPHPNIYSFVEALKDVQSETYVQLRSRAPRKLKKTVEKENFLREKMAELQNKKIDIFDYVKAVSFKFLPKP